MNKSKKVVIVGAGFVGMSYAYSLLNRGVANIIVIVDIDKEKALGEVLDLNHGLAFAPRKTTIIAGDYSDCADADLVVIAAGASQKPNEKRIDLLKKNVLVMKDIVNKIMQYAFKGIFLIATNPVDILAYVVFKESGLESHRVIGSGTVLDTARLRFTISQRLNVDVKNVHAYVLGEHGDSEFVCWSNASIGAKPLLDVIKESEVISLSELEQIAIHVRDVAYQIIAKKKATYYGIGMSLARITEVILNDEKSILPVSTLMSGEYPNINDVYISLPVVLGHDGVLDLMRLPITDLEYSRLIDSADLIRNALEEIGY